MKKFVTIVLIAFAIFFVLTQPQAAADVVKGVGNVVEDVFRSFIDFITALTG